MEYSATPGMMYKCPFCGRDLPPAGYPNTDGGVQLCSRCSRKDPSATAQASPCYVARPNLSDAVIRASSMRRPIASGTFRYVSLGTYPDGVRRGEKCAIKYPKKGHFLKASFWHPDIDASHKAVYFVKRFNETGIVNKLIRVNVPEIAEMTIPDERYASRPPLAVKVLMEPWIENYQKFNSNNGWVDDSTEWGKIMQALSHFSYHHSRGRRLLCDLQGGVYSNELILTDPAVHSVERKYGDTDFGADGISDFFSRHPCNEYCRSSWSKPPKTGTKLRATYSSHTARMEIRSAAPTYDPYERGTRMVGSAGRPLVPSYRHVTRSEARQLREPPDRVIRDDRPFNSPSPKNSPRVGSQPEVYIHATRTNTSQADYLYAGSMQPGYMYPREGDPGYEPPPPGHHVSLFDDPATYRPADRRGSRR